MMIKIDLSVPSYHYAICMCSCINNVLQDHPLGADILTPEVLSNLKVKVDLKPGSGIEINCAQYPLVILILDPAKYESGDSFDEELFKIHLYHEFTHLADRLKKDFGVTMTRKVTDITLDLWNLHINGRLWRQGIKVKSFEDSIQGWFGRRKKPISASARALYKKAWDAEELSYNQIVELAKQIIPLIKNTLGT